MFSDAQLVCWYMAQPLQACGMLQAESAVEAGLHLNAKNIDSCIHCMPGMLTMQLCCLLTAKVCDMMQAESALRAGLHHNA